MSQITKEYQLDKTFLEIKNAFLAGKRVLLQYNNQIIQQIVGFNIYEEQDETSNITYAVYMQTTNTKSYMKPYINSSFNSFEQAINNEQYPIVQVTITNSTDPDILR